MRIGQLIKLITRTRDLKISFQLWKVGEKPEHIRRSKNKFRLSINGTWIIIPEQKLFLLTHYYLLKPIIEGDNFEELKFDQDLLIIKIGGVNLEINSWEDLFIIKEVFIQKIYNFNSKKPFVFIDVGLNSGVTSIFMSSKSNLKKIYAFEPFKETLDIAKRNISRNNLGSKIFYENIGLSNQEVDLEVAYNFELKGSNSVFGNRHINNENLPITKIKVKPASKVLKEIFAQNHEQIIMKLDCEGSEFEIIKDLNSNDLLKYLNVLMIEWHDRNPKIIEEILVENNYSYLRNNDNEKLGMIYAFKN